MYLFNHYKNIFFNLNELAITDTELKLIAKAAMIGDSKISKTENRTLAVTGTPNIL